MSFGKTSCKLSQFDRYIYRYLTNGNFKRELANGVTIDELFKLITLSYDNSPWFRNKNIKRNDINNDFYYSKRSVIKPSKLNTSLILESLKNIQKSKLIDIDLCEDYMIIKFNKDRNLQVY